MQPRATSLLLVAAGSVKQPFAVISNKWEVLALHLREFQMEDYQRVVDLWHSAGIVLSRSDDKEGVAKKLGRDPDLFVVSDDGGRIIGAVMGCYDGRRGWVNHLAVAPDYQRRGLGAAIMAELELRLQAKGCDKVNLLIEPSNSNAQGFYEKLGYERDELIFMEKWLG